tara:strand:- start:89 stop:391 length:303 start_codon:yes stop_codon:yes gene_type:complete
MKNTRETLSVLRKIEKNSNATQREMATDLGYSIGKLNYCIKKLQIKGLIKINNFKKNPNKLNYIYVLTPKGVSEKAKLTINYMKRIALEYDELKKDLKKK